MCSLFKKKKKEEKTLCGTHRNAVRAFVCWSVQQEVPFGQTFDVNAVCCQLLWDGEHIVVVISQLFHHLQTNTHIQHYTQSPSSKPALMT